MLQGMAQKGSRGMELLPGPSAGATSVQLLVRQLDLGGSHSASEHATSNSVRIEPQNLVL